MSKLPFVPFDPLKERVNIIDVMNALPLEMVAQKRPGEWRGKCPACQSADKSLVVTDGKGYTCYSRRGQAMEAQGDVIQLVRHVLDLNEPLEAAHWIVDAFHLDIDELRGKKTVTKPSTVLTKKPIEEGSRGANPPIVAQRGMRPLEHLEPEHEAVTALGLIPDDARRIGVGYAPRGVMKGTVAWPVRLSDGTLIGYIGLSAAILPSNWRY